MISFYKIRVGFPERRVPFLSLNGRFVVWERRYTTDIPPTENLPAVQHRLLQEWHLNNRFTLWSHLEGGLNLFDMAKNPKITEEEIALIKSAKAGDESAFNTLFYKYKSFVDNVLFQYIKDMDEAKDLTNIVFLKVYD